MKYCVNCGAQLDDEDRFCAECGAKQPEAATAAETEESHAEETLPAVSGARSVVPNDAVSIDHDAAVEDDDTVLSREEQFICRLPRDATVAGETADYWINDDESAVIVDFDVDDRNKVKKIVIPETIEDMSVVGIADEVFQSLPALETVTLPDSIMAIGNSAFDSCPSLKSINLPKSLVEIGDYAFRDCSALKQVTAPNGLDDDVDFEDGGDSEAFTGCSSLSLKSQSLLRRAGYDGGF